MTDEQRKAIRILNRLRDTRIDGDSMLDDNDYFFLMSFVICRREVEYVPIYPTYPTFPPSVDPYYQYKYTTTTDLKDNENGKDK